MDASQNHGNRSRDIREPGEEGRWPASRRIGNLNWKELLPQIMLCLCGHKLGDWGAGCAEKVLGRHRYWLIEGDNESRSRTEVVISLGDRVTCFILKDQARKRQSQRIVKTITMWKGKQANSQTNTASQSWPPRLGNNIPGPQSETKKTPESMMDGLAEVIVSFGSIKQKILL
jgi:hypothetical protein